MAPPGDTAWPPLLLVVVLMCFSFGSSQYLPSPNSNPCKLYDPTSGNILTSLSQIDVEIQETDFNNPLDGYFQQHNINLAGGSLVKDLIIEGTYDTLNTPSSLGIGFVQDISGQFWTMIILNKVDRDYEATNKDDFDSLAFKIKCLYDVGPSVEAEAFLDVKISVLDSNDNAPEFDMQEYTVTVPEQVPRTATVFDSMVVEDKDSNLFKKVARRIVSGQMFQNEEYFTMTDNGSVLLNTNLDYEKLAFFGVNQFDLIIEVKDNPDSATNSLSSTATLHIPIANSDDLTPCFWHPDCLDLDQYLPYSCASVNYRANIFSGTVNNNIQVVPIVSNGGTSNFSRILALDRDDLNAPIQFTLTTSPANLESKFSVTTNGPIADPDNRWPGRSVYEAVISQIGVVNRQDAIDGNVFLRIMAYQTDNADMYRIAEVRFNELQVNSNPPIITPGGTSVKCRHGPLGQ